MFKIEYVIIKLRLSFAKKSIKIFHLIKEGFNLAKLVLKSAGAFG